MRAHWKSDACYAQFGVDGTDCTFRVYLSEVESWCPALAGRNVKPLNATTVKVTKVCWFIQMLLKNRHTIESFVNSDSKQQIRPISVESEHQ